MLRITLLTGVLLGLLAAAANAGTIGAAKAERDGATVMVTGSITLLYPTECYIESTDRSAGVCVQADTTGFAVGDLVAAIGTIATVDGERVIQSATLTAAGARCPIAPFAMRGNWIGGANRSGIAALQDWVWGKIRTPQQQTYYGYRWQLVGGAPNTGLLVTTWGKVTAVCYSPTTNARWFHLDDGSRAISDYGDSGIIVYSYADVAEGDFVTVTGASSIEAALDDPTRLVRVVRPVSDGASQPFNDEFGRNILDPRWSVAGSPDSISLTANPGWLTLSATDSVLAICQQAPGCWDLEAKFRVDVPPAGAALRLLLTETPDQAQGVTIATVEPSPDGSGGILSIHGYQLLFATSTTFWLRARVTSWSEYALVSTDGVSYTAGLPLSWGATSATYPYLQLRAECAQSSFSPAIDYIRFTKVYR